MLGKHSSLTRKQVVENQQSGGNESPITRSSLIYFPTSRKPPFHRANKADPRHHIHLPRDPPDKHPSADDSPHRVPRISFMIGASVMIIILTLGIASLLMIALRRKTS